MMHIRRILSLLVGVIGMALLVTPAWASLIERPVVVMTYQGALGGTIHISADGGKSFEYVYAGPYEFSVTGVDHLVAMYCDSASYNLVMFYPYVQLTGTDVLNGYGRLYDQAIPATAQSTYMYMSWALQYAFTQNTQEWYKAAQIYIWELMSDVVYGQPFDLAHGTFQVASTDLATVSNDVNFIHSHATANVMADLSVPVTMLQNDSGATYSDSLSGATMYFKNSESSQEFFVDPLTPVPEPTTLSLITLGLAGLGGIAWRHWKD